MGPRPPRPRLPAPAGVPRPLPVVVTAGRPVPPVGAPSPRRAAIAETVPLPIETRTALSAIARTMRDVPRSLIGDPAEVVHFLGRTARAIERLRDQPVSTTGPAAKATRPTAKAPSLPPPPRALSARERAEAVFSGAAPPTSTTSSPPTSPEAMFRASGGALPRPRIVMDRKSRGVRVEVRRAREAGQMEMPL